MSISRRQFLTASSPVIAALPARPLFAGQRMPASTTYIAGHAQRGLPVTAGRTALQRQRDYFDAALTHVRAGIGARKSRDEIVSLTASRDSIPPGVDSRLVPGGNPGRRLRR